MRPISLINFNNKIISIVIHERLVGLLPNLISDEQDVFLKVRSIAKDVLLTQEIITDIRFKTIAGPNVVIKLNVTKAYDRISWLFLTMMLRKMGFCKRFIGLMYGIISNNWYSVLINGQPHDFFKSTRSVGNPLSPTLFILVVEALSRDVISLQLVMKFLSACEVASGQLVNKIKSAIYMHHSTSMEVVTMVERITGIGRQDFPFTYLACPIFYSRRRMEYYQGLFSKSMDIHLLSTVNPPNYVINKLHKIFAQFLWSSSIGGSSRHWESWNTLLIVPWREGSHIWRKMLECRDLIEQQITWHPEMGSSLFWFDNWTSLRALHFLVSYDFGIDESIHNVYDVVGEDVWNVDSLLKILHEEYALHIMGKLKPPTMQHILDVPFWMQETRGHFSVKTAWDYLSRRDEPRIAYKMIWVKGLPFKISFFMWKVWKAKLSLDDFM
ncbi:uncharacterized protein [Nicotiana tomentosiformis]|uniref:uncharacterized protein n=1 Tax=Nicotiana tomentosiformis TaxID=4098 RepID=UPI00388C5E01